MKIRLIGHTYKYEIEQMIRLFFPGEKIEYADTEQGPEDEAISLRSSLQADSVQAVAVTALTVYGEAYHDTQCETMATENLGPEEAKRICKSLVKMSFYKAAIQAVKIDLPWGTLTGIRPTKIVHQLMAEGKNDAEIEERLKMKYAVTHGKAQLAIEVAHHEKRILEQSHPDSIGLYIGIPFCPTRCLYCSFISNSVERAQRFVEPYMQALLKELESTAELIRHKGWQVESIYIGGGTPTTLSAPLLEKLLESVALHLDISKLKEYTVEAGRPDTIDEDKLKVMKKFRIGRLSINPQTMNGETLRLIGRNHSPEDIITAYHLAREHGFDNINMDLIAGLPGESTDMYLHTLEEIKKLNPESITVHTMSIKRASRLNQKKEEYNITHAGTVLQMLDHTQACMKEMGKKPYYLYRQKNILGNLENVGYCTPGYEGIYNIQIMEEKQSIIALGSGGVTKLVDRKLDRIERIFNVKDVEEYMKRIDEMIERKR